MRYLAIFLLGTLVLSLNISCEKDPEATCQQLKNSIINSDKEQVKTIISQFITTLPSSTYTQQNLNALASSIQQHCSMNTSSLCFDCIQTMPTQSEIRISFVNGATTVEKTIDISYNSNNKMIFYNLHD
ncbi:MAG TPA: hypothetical protein VF487_19980 [Chitinophagaceae bacterium]